ncbi:MAG: disulfide bond formation protein B [Alphaproteobacteria bacterium]|nr:disulfide bond formation protein B [Alphaproteobacteria bacterium]
MTAWAQWMQPRWPLFALLASAAMLAAAHAFERLGGLLPCELCLRQREVYWGAMAIAVAGLVALRFWPRRGVKRALAVFLGLSFLTGALVAGYHVGVENGVFIHQCDAAFHPGDIRPLDATGDFIAPACDTVQWSMLGVSMAGFNAAISAVLAVASFAIAFSPSLEEQRD